ncbi:hypothetical protein J6590_074466 [Homalodisca vitripennis]|nr:hypothetical protein J6590_074466 [Homalodisca vitripennis]
MKTVATVGRPTDSATHSQTGQKIVVGEPQTVGGRRVQPSDTQTVWSEKIGPQTAPYTIRQVPDTRPDEQSTTTFNPAGVVPITTASCQVGASRSILLLCSCRVCDWSSGAGAATILSARKDGPIDGARKDERRRSRI